MRIKSQERRANYGFTELIIISISYVYTKLCWKNARLIRYPIRIRNKSGMEYGKGFTTGYSCRIEMNGTVKDERLTIGENCIIGDYAHIVANSRVIIGNNVLMASRVFITDTNHGNYSDCDISSSAEIAPSERPLSYRSVTIGNNVWIGENVAILPGVYIGDGCIVGANSVVTKNIPDNCIVAGVPAKVVKRYNPDTSLWEKI